MGSNLVYLEGGGPTPKSKSTYLVRRVCRKAKMSLGKRNQEGNSPFVRERSKTGV